MSLPHESTSFHTASKRRRKCCDIKHYGSTQITMIQQLAGSAFESGALICGINNLAAGL
jgi:hypothetical protein